MKHPMGSTEHLEDVTKWALDFIFKCPAHLVKMERRKNLLQAKLLAAKLAEDEKTLHDGFPPSLRSWRGKLAGMEGAAGKVWI